MTKIKFEPVYSSEYAAKRRKSTYGAKSVKKVKGKFEFFYGGRKRKRKTGWKLIGGHL